LQPLAPEQKARIASALESRGATLPCPRCGTREFTLLDGYFNHPLQTELNVFNIGGPSVPIAVVACVRCGFLAQHALGALGLLPLAQETPK
jgi:hypothetical protein